MAIDVPDWIKLTQLAAPGDLGAVVIQPGLQSVTVNVNLSPYATGIIIVSYSTFAFISWAVTGGVTAFPYITAFAVFNPSPPLIANVGGAIDNPISVEALASSVNGTGLPQTVGHVYQLFGSGSQFVQSTPQQPVFTREVPSLVAPGAVSMSVARFTANLAPGAASTIVAPTAGQQLIVYGYDVHTSMVAPAAGSVFAILEDTGPSVQFASCRVSMATAVGISGKSQSLEIAQGIPLQLGAGIRALAFAGNAINVLLEGSIIFASLPYIL